jgi:hypothetical protein
LDAFSQWCLYRLFSAITLLDVGRITLIDFILVRVPSGNDEIGFCSGVACCFVSGAFVRFSGKDLTTSVLCGYSLDRCRLASAGGGFWPGLILVVEDDAMSSEVAAAVALCVQREGKSLLLAASTTPPSTKELWSGSLCTLSFAFPPGDLFSPRSDSCNDEHWWTKERAPSSNSVLPLAIVPALQFREP